MPPRRALHPRPRSAAAASSSLPPPPPQTADDALAAGVALEEAGDKWRAGDAAKAARFYARAVDAYEAGLARWPGREGRHLAFNV